MNLYMLFGLVIISMCQNCLGQSKIEASISTTQTSTTQTSGVSKELYIGFFLILICLLVIVIICVISGIWLKIRKWCLVNGVINSAVNFKDKIIDI